MLCFAAMTVSVFGESENFRLSLSSRQSFFNCMLGWCLGGKKSVALMLSMCKFSRDRKAQSEARATVFA